MLNPFLPHIKDLESKLSTYFARSKERPLTLVKENYNKVGVDAVLKTSIGLPYAGILFAQTPPQYDSNKWDELYRKYLGIKVYALNTDFWIKSKKIELVELTNEKTPKTYIHQPQDAHTASNSSSEGSTTTPQVSGSQNATQDFELYFKTWKDRTYVNGRGWKPLVKAANLLALFGYEVTSDGQVSKDGETINPAILTQPLPKVWVQRGEVLTKPTLPITPQAKEYILNNYQTTI